MGRFVEKLDENFNEFECCSCKQKVRELDFVDRISIFRKR